MTKNESRERLFRDYCASWLTRDVCRFSDFFTDDAVYTESDGARYEGLAELRAWFARWLPHGEVLEWRVLRFLHQGDAAAAEWFFRCRYDGEESAFNGVTLMDFDRCGKIRRLSEFAARLTPEKAENDAGKIVGKS